MKRILYALAFISFSACNSKSTQTQTATQGGLSGLQTSSTATTETQSGLLTNPEHGKPGHDCALPVGAPLTQKATTSNTPQTATPTTETSIAPQPATAKPASSPKTNPAHGQPGHKCELPVGAPLS